MNIATADVAYTAPNGTTHTRTVATPSDKLLTERLESGIYCLEDGELQKRCSRCNVYWPADTEFFFTKKGGDGLNPRCKACYKELRYPSGRNEKTQSVEQGEAA